MGLRVTPAMALVNELRRAGILLTARADRLYYRPIVKVSEETRRLLQLHKTEILVMLRTERSRSLWPEDLDDFGTRSVGSFARCIRCGHGSWVRYGSTVLCLPCAKLLRRRPGSKTSAVVSGATPAATIGQAIGDRPRPPVASHHDAQRDAV
jgi:hypothetical protein